jgi:ABC-type Fe3+ transport system permease subunit
MILTILMYYMAIGAVVFVCLLVYGRLQPGDEVPWSIGKPSEKKTWKSWAADVLLIPHAIVFFFVPLWPFILSIQLNFPWHKLKFWTSKAERDIPWTPSD